MSDLNFPGDFFSPYYADLDESSEYLESWSQSISSQQRPSHREVEDESTFFSTPPQQDLEHNFSVPLPQPPMDAGVRQVLGCGWQPLWNPASPLGVWKLVHPCQTMVGEPVALAIDPIIPSWLSGRLGMGKELAEVVRRPVPLEPLEDWPIDEITE